MAKLVTNGSNPNSYLIEGYQVNLQYRSNQGPVIEILKDGKALNETELNTALHQIGLADLPTNLQGLLVCERFLSLSQSVSRFKNNGSLTNEALIHEHSMQQELAILKSTDDREPLFNMDETWLTSTEAFLGEIHQFGITQADENLASAIAQFESGDVFGYAHQSLQLALSHQEGLSPEQVLQAKNLEIKLAQENLESYIKNGIGFDPKQYRSELALENIFQTIDKKNETAQLPDYTIAALKDKVLHDLFENFSIRLSQVHSEFKNSGLINKNRSLDLYIDIMNTKMALSIVMNAQGKSSEEIEAFLAKYPAKQP